MKLSNLFTTLVLTSALAISSSTTLLIKQNKSLAEVVQENMQSEHTDDNFTENLDSEAQNYEVYERIPEEICPNADDVLSSDELLTLKGSNRCLVSSYRTHLLSLQTDGNLVLYKHIGSAKFLPTWSSRTNGKPVDRLRMQNDGNLVIYSTTNQPLWTSNTNGNPGAYLRVQNDGNLVIYRNGKPIWTTNTQGR